MGEGTMEAVVEMEETDVVVTTTIKEVDQNLYGRLGHPSAGGEGASKKKHSPSTILHQCFGNPWMHNSLINLTLMHDVLGMQT